MKRRIFVFIMGAFTLFILKTIFMKSEEEKIKDVLDEVTSLLEINEKKETASRKEISSIQRKGLLFEEYFTDGVLISVVTKHFHKALLIDKKQLVEQFIKGKMALSKLQINHEKISIAVKETTARMDLETFIHFIVPSMSKKTPFEDVLILSIMWKKVEGEWLISEIKTITKDSNMETNAKK